jgi:AraC family transcriptional regulator
MEQPTRPYPTDAAQQPSRNDRLTFVENSETSGISMPAHTHRQASLCLILRGRHTLTCRKASHIVEPGTLVFLPAEELHQCCFHTEAKIFSMSLEPSWIEQLHPHLTMLDHPSYHSTDALTPLAVRAYKEFRSKDVFSPLALEGLVLEILAGIARHNVNDIAAIGRLPPRWLRQANDLLHERFAESLSLDEIAQAVEAHPAHLSRMFRRYYHSTIGEYLRVLRLQSACRILTTSALPLGEVALSCGYTEQSNFTTAFKRHTGLTPKEYRKIFYKR